MAVQDIGRVLVQQAGQKASAMAGTALNTGGAGASDKADRASREQKQQTGLARKSLEMSKGAPRMMHKVMKGAGISMGVSGILKQSQIFTGIVGSLFQILGAFVDVILAPFIPIFVPALRWLAGRLPKVSAWAQAIAEPVTEKILAIGRWLKEAKDNPKGAIADIWDAFIGWVKGVITAGWGKVVGFFKMRWFDIQTWLIETIKAIPLLGKGFMKDYDPEVRAAKRKALEQRVLHRSAIKGMSEDEIQEFMKDIAREKRAEAYDNITAVQGAALRIGQSQAATSAAHKAAGTYNKQIVGGFSGISQIGAKASVGSMTYREALQLYEQGWLSREDLAKVKMSWGGDTNIMSQSFKMSDYMAHADKSVFSGGLVDHVTAGAMHLFGKDGPFEISGKYMMPETSAFGTGIDGSGNVQWTGREFLDQGAVGHGQWGTYAFNTRGVDADLSITKALLEAQMAHQNRDMADIGGDIS